jgi:phosphoribosylamine--glycine ligase
LKTDFAELILSATEEKLSGIEPEWDQRVSACIAVSSRESHAKDSNGIGITGLEEIKMMQDTFAFHENTLFRNSDIVTSGGRVLCVTSMGKDLRDASTRAYHAVEKIHFDGIYYKKDIG